MKNIICYSSGGLGNRLNPFISCLWLANKTQRKLNMCWHPFLRCQAEFNDLFYNHIHNVSFSELEALEDVIIYSNTDAADYEYSLNNTDSLKKVYSKYPIKPLSSISDIVKDVQKNVVIFSNTFLPLNIPKDELMHAFQKLIPISKISHEIKKYKSRLDKEWIGCHIRTTDFHVDVNYYLTQMQSLYANNKNSKFFVCSDSKECEDLVKSLFPIVEYRVKNHFVSKNNANKNWDNNVLTPMESVQEALIDLYLLGKTTIKVYHPNSSFTKLAQLISV